METKKEKEYCECDACISRYGICQTCGKPVGGYVLEASPEPEKTAEEIMEDIAKKYGCRSWSELKYEKGDDGYFAEAMKAYADQEVAAEKKRILQSLAKAKDMWANIKWDGEPTPYDQLKAKADKLVKALEAESEYSRFLSTEISRTASFLNMHNMAVSEEDWRKGKELRKKVAETRAALNE